MTEFGNVSRDLPQVDLSPCNGGYASLVASGFDSVQEAFALTPTPAFVKILEESQEAARELRDDLEATIEVEVGSEKFQAHATGAKGGFRWRLENDDFMILIGSPRRDWTISVRYLSAGIWEHGLQALQQRALEALHWHTEKLNGFDFIRTSRVDYCFDFYSPQFTKEFDPGLSKSVVVHSSAKAHEAGSYNLWARGGRGETLTIGSKALCQVQVYDKTLEIDEVSGKTWMHDLWRLGDRDKILPADAKLSDMWRLECRFAGEFLKQRNLRRPNEVLDAMPKLIGEALYKRRLCVPSASDDNRWRWPVHPLWSEAIRCRADEMMLPIGKRVTGRRVALVQQAEAAIGGSIASALILQDGEYTDLEFHRFVERCRARVQADPNRARKEMAARMRYSLVDQAR